MRNTLHSTEYIDILPHYKCGICAYILCVLDKHCVYLSMFEIVRNIPVYRLFAFETEKGIFTNIGVDISKRSQHLDEFLNIETGEIFFWDRSRIVEWERLGKIKPVEISKQADWYLNEKEGKYASK